MSPANTVGGLVASARLGLGPGGVGVLRVGMSHVPLGREVLCGLAPSVGSLNWTFFKVLLMLWEGEVMCGLDTKGSWKVILLAIFLKPPGILGLGRVTAYM